MQFIDTHCHLDQPEFDEDRTEVIHRAEQAGVTTMLAVGVGLASSEAAIQLSDQHQSIWAAVGIQPNYCAEAHPEDWQRIVALADSPRVVAIGETGLDRYWDYTPFDVQQDYFDRHLRLARELDLPFIVHTRECDEDAVAMLTAAAEQSPLRGVMHSFCGTLDTAQACLALGLHISVAGMVTFKKSHELRAVAKSIPEDRILIETDAPYLSPHPLRGKRNEPGRVVHTAECLAEARDVPLEDFAAQTTANARDLFRFGT